MEKRKEKKLKLEKVENLLISVARVHGSILHVLSYEHHVNQCVIQYIDFFYLFSFFRKKTESHPRICVSATGESNCRPQDIGGGD